MILADTLSISINLLLVAHVVISLLLILVVLMQRPKQEGLGAAFGGGVTDQMFGAQTTNVLQKGTVYLGSAFLLLSLVLAILIGNKNYTKAMSQPAPAKIEEAPAVPEPATLPEGESIKDELDKAGGTAPTGDETTPATGAEDKSTEPAPAGDGEETTPATGDEDKSTEPAPVEEGAETTPATGAEDKSAEPAPVEEGAETTPAEGNSTGSDAASADPVPPADPSEDKPE